MKENGPNFVLYNCISYIINFLICYTTGLVIKHKAVYVYMAYDNLIYALSSITSFASESYKWIGSEKVYLVT